MIELIKSDDEDVLLDWADEVCRSMQHKVYNEDGRSLYLSLDFEDNMYCQFDGETFIVDVGEETHDTTEMREENIRFIKTFVQKEMPYLVFDHMGKSADADYGFRLVYKLKGD